MGDAIEEGEEAVPEGTLVASRGEATARAESSGSVAHSLVVAQGAKPGSRREIGETPKVIGRASECDLVPVCSRPR